MSSFVSIDTGIREPRFERAWPSEDGAIIASVILGDAKIYFCAPEDARAVATACIKAAAAMEAPSAAGQDGGTS